MAIILQDLEFARPEMMMCLGGKLAILIFPMQIHKPCQHHPKIGL